MQAPDKRGRRFVELQHWGRWTTAERSIKRRWPVLDPKPLGVDPAMLRQFLKWLSEHDGQRSRGFDLRKLKLEPSNSAREQEQRS